MIEFKICLYFGTANAHLFHIQTMLVADNGMFNMSDCLQRIFAFYWFVL